MRSIVVRAPAIIALALAALLLDAPAAVARDAVFSRAVNDRVRAARDVAPALGVHVLDLESGESAYSYNVDTQRIVASNAKLVTAAAALDTLGPGYFFETDVLVDGLPRAGVLAGDLAVIGGGDPTLSGRFYAGDSYGAFREWAASLRRAGVERIDGDLVLVHGRFADGLVHADWPRDQLSRWYEAPVSALSFNDNCVLVKVWPGPAAGRRPEIETVPALDRFGIENSARTSGRGGQLRISRRPGADVLTVSGALRPGPRAQDAWVAVADPVAYFGAALRDALAEEGIAIAGRTRPVAALPAGRWRLAHRHRSDLLTVLEVVNKRSQNFFAESVLKTVGYERCGAGTWDAGLRAAAEFLAGIGIEAGSYRMADGSGMSRNNRFTPRQLTHLLDVMQEHRHARAFMRTLPYSGENGISWQKRLAAQPYRGNVLAKTGTLNGVSTLSGYAKARSGRLYAFSILCNQSRAAWQAKKAQDAIVRAIIDHG